MASARKNVPAVVVPAPTFVLTLSTAEAHTLRDILRSVGGNPDNTRRRHADAIEEALGGAGAMHSAGGGRPLDLNGSINFVRERE